MATENAQTTSVSITHYRHYNSGWSSWSTKLYGGYAGVNSYATILKIYVPKVDIFSSSENLTLNIPVVRQYLSSGSSGNSMSKGTLHCDVFDYAPTKLPAEVRGKGNIGSSTVTYSISHFNVEILTCEIPVKGRLTPDRDYFVYMSLSDCSGTGRAKHLSIGVNSKIGRNYTAEVSYFSNVTLKYDKNTDVDVGGMPTDQQLTYGSSGNISSEHPSRENYTFEGWAESSTGPVKYHAGDEITLVSDTTLYAIWKPLRFTIKFYNGNAIIKTIFVRYKESFDFSSIDRPEKIGYIFTQWSTNGISNDDYGWTDSRGEWKYAYGEHGISGSGELSLYAIFVPIKYSILFNLCGGSYENQQINMNKDDCVYDDGVILPSEEDVHKKGYKLLHWCTTVSGDGTIYEPGSTVKNLTANNEETITLYAIWENATFSITYNIDDTHTWTDNSVIRGDRLPEYPAYDKLFTYHSCIGPWKIKTPKGVVASWDTIASAASYDENGKGKISLFTESVPRYEVVYIDGNNVAHELTPVYIESKNKAKELRIAVKKERL